MNLRKRTLALLLTVCMLLSVAVPMVSAALYTKIQFGSNYSDNWEYIATSDGATDLATAAGSYLNPTFKKANATAGDWLAIRVKGASQGEYHLSLQPSANKNCGLANIYLLPDTDLTEAAAIKNYVTTNMTESNYLGVFDSFTGAVIQDMGTVNLSGSSFILVINPSTEQPNSKYRCYLAAVNLLPAQTAADADSLATVLTNIADTGDGRYATVKLTGSFAIDSVTIPANVTIDLNGNTLTATNCTFSGKLADSANGTGMLKTAPITVASDDLLLYDSTNEGYRVYNDYTVAPHGTALQDMGNGAKRLWIKLTFTNKDAYRVIATGNSGIEIGAALNWTPAEGTAVNTTLSFQDSHEVLWGTNMQTAETYGFYIEFTGFDTLAAGTLTLTPAVNGVSSASSIVYNHTAG